MDKILIRVDGSTKIGFGHIMRCMALAEGLKKAGLEVYFVNKNYNSFYKIMTPGFRGLQISHTATLEEDLQLTVNYAQKNNVNTIVTDSYEIDSSYIYSLKQRGFFLISIDDMAKNHFVSDIILNQNICARVGDYNGKVENYTKLLLGTKYALLREEFQNNREDKQIKRKVQNVLITFGGGDTENQTLKVAQAIKKTDWSINVAIGAGYPYLDKLKSFVEKAKLNIHQDTNKMVELMDSADIAISASGSTVWELCYIGVPTIIIACAKNQFLIAKELHRQNIMLSLGWFEDVSQESIVSASKKLAESQELRERLSINSRKIVDGKGVQRVVKEILATLCKK